MNNLVGEFEGYEWTILQYHRSLLMQKWEELNQAVGGDLFTNDEKIAAMRRVDKRMSSEKSGFGYAPEMVAEMIAGWNEFQDEVLKEVDRVARMSPDEKTELPEDEVQTLIRECVETDRMFNAREAQKNEDTAFELIMESGLKLQRKSYEEHSFLQRSFIHAIALFTGSQINNYRNVDTGFTSHEEKMLKIIEKGNQYFEETRDDYMFLSDSEHLLNCYRNAVVDEMGHGHRIGFEADAIFAFAEIHGLRPASCVSRAEIDNNFTI